MGVGDVVVMLSMLYSNPHAAPVNQNYAIENIAEQDSTEIMLNSRLEKIVEKIKNMPMEDAKNYASAIGNADARKFISGLYTIAFPEPDTCVVLEKIGQNNFFVFIKKQNEKGPYDLKNYFAVDKVANIFQEDYDLLKSALSGKTMVNLDVLKRAITECETVLQQYVKK